jgi:hypothetical protein
MDRARGEEAVFMVRAVKFREEEPAESRKMRAKRKRS